MGRGRADLRAPPSPSTRREWIEIRLLIASSRCCLSPSTRREWIEMTRLSCTSWIDLRLPPHGGSGLKSHSTLRLVCRQRSPSTRREWIEIGVLAGGARHLLSPSTRREWIEMSPSSGGGWIMGLPPHGGSGLKCRRRRHCADGILSPSTRREWIEIQYRRTPARSPKSLPPHGGSGLK